MEERKNWRVTYYDASDLEISSHIITDRTEHEVENEAMADMPSNCEDWSLMPI